MTDINITAIKALLKQPTGKAIRDREVTGFIAKRISTGVSYHYEYRAGHGRNAPVRRISIGKHGGITPDQARTVAKAHALARANGHDPAEERSRSKTMPTLAEFAKELFAKMKQVAINQPLNARPGMSTLKGYRHLMDKHIGPAFGHRKVHEILTRHVRDFHQELSIGAPVTANRCLQLISSLYGYMVQDEVVPRWTNPASGVKKNPEHGCERFLSSEEKVRLGEAIRIAETVGVPCVVKANPDRKSKHIPKTRPPYVISKNAGDAIRVISYMGSRMGEPMGAKWTELDLEHGVLTRFTKTGRRPILIPAAALAIFRQMPRIGEYVFPLDTDPTRPKRNVQKQWNAVRRLAGLDGVRLYDLRHSFASVAVSSVGSSLPVVAKLLGHTQYKTTQRYAHLANDPVRKTLEKSADHIQRLMDRGARAAGTEEERG